MVLTGFIILTAGIVFLLVIVIGQNFIIKQTDVLADDQQLLLREQGVLLEEQAALIREATSTINYCRLAMTSQWAPKSHVINLKN